VVGSREAVRPQADRALNVFRNSKDQQFFYEGQNVSVKRICINISPVFVRRRNMLKAGFIACSLCAMPLVFVPCAAEASFGGAAKVADEYLLGPLVNREMPLKDIGVTVIVRPQELNGGNEGGGKFVGGSVKSANPVDAYSNKDADKGNDCPKNSVLHWLLPYLLILNSLILLYYVFNFSLHLRAAQKIGVYFRGSMFRRGDKKITAYYFQRYHKSGQAERE